MRVKWRQAGPEVESIDPDQYMLEFMLEGIALRNLCAKLKIKHGLYYSHCVFARAVQVGGTVR